MSRTRNYVAGLVTGIIATIATVAVGLWLTPFTLRFLDREEYAIFALVGDVVMWLGLLDIGISSGMHAQVMQLTGNPDTNRLNQLASTAFFSQLIVSILVVIVGLGVSLYFPIFFEVRPNLYEGATEAVFLVMIGTALSMGSRVFSSLLVAHQQLYVDNVIRVVLVVVRTALTVYLLLAGWGMISLAVAQVVGLVISTFLSVVRTYRLLPRLELRWKHFSKGVLVKTGSLGIWFTLGGIAGMLIPNFDRVVTAKVVSVEMVTTLSLTGRLYFLAANLVQLLTDNARPMLGQMWGAGRKDEALRLYHQLTALSTGLAVVVALAIWSGNSRFVQWWVGSQNYGGWLLDMALAMNFVMHLWVLPNRAALVGALSYVPHQNGSRFIEGILNLLLSVWMGQLFGVVGIVAATTAAGVLTSVWYLPFLTARTFGTTIRKLTIHNTVRVLTLTSLLIPLSFLFRMLTQSFAGLIGFGLPAVLVGTSGVFLVWFVVLEGETKRRVRSMISRFSFPKSQQGGDMSV